MNIRKIISLILCFAILVNFSANSYAMINNTPKLVKIGEVAKHLKYFREDRGYSTYVVCSVVGFYENNTFYPAYCMNKNLPGAENGEYEVNIKSILNNPAVWRVISNGYPYKTCNQLGLENDFDAFAVTKFAVYCVLGESKIEYYSAAANDAYGQKMLQVLRQLVDIGINGTDLPNSNMTITQLSDIKENEKYFYIDYTINSNIEVNSYTITKLNNFPEGTICTDLNNTNKKTFSNNEIVRLQILKEKFNKDINGEIVCLAKCKTYPIFYGEAPSGKQDYVVTYDGIEKLEFKSNINLKTNTGSLKILKKDGDSLKRIPNVKFELSNEFYKYEVQTDEEGKANFENIYPGKYKLKEIYVPDEYKMLEEEIDVEILYNETKEIEITNELKKGSLKILKKDKDSLKGIPNVKFELSNEFYKYEVQTDEEGKANFENIYPGKYKLKEIYVPNEYKMLEEEIDVEILYNETKEIEITNELKKGNLKIIKQGTDRVKLPGVEFELYDENMNLIEKLVTNENGEVFSCFYPSENKKYFLKEVQTADGYLLNDEIIEIKLEDDNCIQILIENKKEEKPSMPDEPLKEETVHKEIKLPKTGY